MKNYEKHALVKFTSIYFLSIAFFVIVLGYLYHLQQENMILQKYTMKMHQYMINLKQTDFKYTKEGYSYRAVKNSKFQYKLAKKEGDYYQKIFPHKKEESFLIQIKSKFIDDELYKINRFIIISQAALLVLFLIISIILAKLSLKPINDTIAHLDRFIKDIIHDINTPATSILLNTKMLDKEIDNESSKKKLKRIKKSADEIGSLYENLEIILKKELPKKKIDLYNIFEDKKELFEHQFTNIKIDIKDKAMFAETNEQAIGRIIDNILVNACKYSKEDGLINISFKNNTLTINDNGKGMEYPHKIFQRSYHENENGHGIGMHIVQRLCDDLDIKIDVDSKQNVGTVVTLKFNH